MKVTQYVRQERAIVAADTGGIRERWLWGLRILRDPEAMAESGQSLKHGVAQQLIHAAARRGIKLNEREIQRRIQAARTYKTEAEIRRAATDFETWRDLYNAGFPTYETPEGEPPADHRTEAERRRDQNAAMLAEVDQYGIQPALFPLDQFEPTEATLKDLQDYLDEQESITARFVEHNRRQREYLEALIEAASDDMSMTWEAAAKLLPEHGGDEDDSVVDDA